MPAPGLLTAIQGGRYHPGFIVEEEPHLIPGIQALPHLRADTFLFLRLVPRCLVVLRGVIADRRQHKHVIVGPLLLSLRLELSCRPPKEDASLVTALCRKYRLQIYPAAILQRRFIKGIVAAKSTLINLNLCKSAFSNVKDL